MAAVGWYSGTAFPVLSPSTLLWSPADLSNGANTFPSCPLSIVPSARPHVRSPPGDSPAAASTMRRWEGICNLLSTHTKR